MAAPAKEIVVFGATGFVGAQTTKFLLSRGFSVRAVCRDVSDPTQTWMREKCGLAQQDDSRLSFHKFDFPSDLVPERVYGTRTEDDGVVPPTRTTIVSDIYEHVVNAETGAVSTTNSKTADTLEALFPLLANTSGAVFCIGFEHQTVATINFMVGSALTLLAGVARVVAAGPPVDRTRTSRYPVVLTSSTGSTNKPGADATVPKSELTAWSDPDTQLKNKRFSPCAKTLMEIEALRFCGRDQQNQLVRRGGGGCAPGEGIRLSIINP